MYTWNMSEKKTVLFRCKEREREREREKERWRDKERAR